MSSSRRPKPRPGAFRIVDHRGRWARGLAWRVTTSAGEPHDLSSLQESVRRAITWQAGHGRHRCTLRELADLVGARHPASVWHALARLRSLNLIGYAPPLRGRQGHFRFWIPSPGSARLAARSRAERWPSRAGLPPDRPGSADPSRNVVTPTGFAGFLSREGIRRAWRARSADQGGNPPPTAPPPDGWRRDSRRLRARGRPFPPSYVDEPCPSRGHRVRLSLTRSLVDPTGDTAATWSGRCRRDRRALAVGLVLVAGPDPRPELVADVVAGLGFGASPARHSSSSAMNELGASPPAGDTLPLGSAPSPAPGIAGDIYDPARRPPVGRASKRGGPESGPAGTVPPDRPAADDDATIARRRAELAALFIADGVDPRLADELRVTHQGYRRPPLERPDPRPPIVAEPGALLGLEDVDAIAWRYALADLERVRGSRRLELPRRDET